MSRQNPPSRIRRSYTAGTTLIELLVVITLLGVCTSIGIRMFVGLTATWNDAQAQSEMHAAAGNALDSIRADCALTPGSNLTGGRIEGIRETKESEDRRYRQIALANDRLTLPVTTASGGAYAQVTYALDSKDTHSLIRSENATRPAEGEADSGVTVLVPRFDVVRLRFEYQEVGHSEWLESWARPEYPAAIRVSLTLADSIDTRLQVSRKAVFQIRVR